MKALSSEHDMTTALMQDMHRMNPTRSVIVLVGVLVRFSGLQKYGKDMKVRGRCVRELLGGEEANRVGLDMI